MMAETCLLAEAAICYPPLYDELRGIQPRPTETVETVAIAAVAAASEQNASAIIVLSTSGNTGRLISKYRPRVPIITGENPSTQPLFNVNLMHLIKSLVMSRRPAKFISTVDVIHSGTLSPVGFLRVNGRRM
jgi:pyruvate kinase